MKLGQTDYILKIAQKHCINKDNPTVVSQWKPGVELQLAEGEPYPELVTTARSIIGAISWASNATRKDVLAPIKTASRVMHRPTPALIDFLMHLLQHTTQAADVSRGRGMEDAQLHQDSQEPTRSVRG